MTVFLTPDRKPFTGATYFPEPRFAAVLEKISDAWRENRGEVEAQGERVVQTFQRALGGGGAALLTETEAEGRVRALAGEALRTAFKQLDQTYDEARGGFGRRLKFPRPSELNFLVRVGTWQTRSYTTTDQNLQPRLRPSHTAPRPRQPRRRRRHRQPRRLPLPRQRRGRGRGRRGDLDPRPGRARRPRAAHGAGDADGDG